MARGLLGIAAQVALVLQGGEVRVHRGRRRQADGLADLAHARRVALLPGLGVDELEHLALAGGEPGGRVGGRLREVVAWALDMDRR